MIEFSCATCGKPMQAEDGSAGQHAVCPDCGRDVLIPNAVQTFATAATPLPRTPRPADRHIAEPYLEEDRVGESGYEYGPSKTSGKAVASLILGIASLLCNIFTGIPALVLGILSLVQINRSRGRIRGQGLAIGGIVTGALGMVIGGIVLPVLVGLLLPAVQKLRDATGRQQSFQNLRMIGLAMHEYNAAHGTLPPAVVHDRDGKPLYSWRVLLLPYLNQDDLYKQFKLDEPWDGPNNVRLLRQMPRVYRHPRDAPGDNSSTIYQVIVGKGAAFEGSGGLRFQDFRDGTSNTLLVVEAADAVPWTKPDDLTYAADRPLPRFSQRSSGGFGTVFADGSVRTIPKETKEPILRALITRNGGERVPLGF